MAEIDTSKMSPEEILKAQKQNCIFCKIISGEIPSKKLYEDKKCLVVLDINPANEGHCLILPKEHYQIMPQIPEEVIGHLFTISKKTSHAILQSTLGASTSIFVANGAAAGQKAPHFMIHVIPRKSETEFLTIPSSQANQADLDKLKEILVQKMFQLLGRSPVFDKLDEKPQTNEISQKSNNQDEQSQNEPEQGLDQIDLDNLNFNNLEPKTSSLNTNIDIDDFDFLNLQPSAAVQNQTVSQPEYTKQSKKKKMTLDDIQKMLLGDKDE